MPGYQVQFVDGGRNTFAILEIDGATNDEAVEKARGLDAPFIGASTWSF